MIQSLEILYIVSSPSNSANDIYDTLVEAILERTNDISDKIFSEACQIFRITHPLDLSRIYYKEIRNSNILMQFKVIDPSILLPVS